MLIPFRSVVSWLVVAVVIAVNLVDSKAIAQQIESTPTAHDSIPKSAHSMGDWSNDSVQVSLDQRTLWLVPTKRGLAEKRFTIPRLCAPIRSVQWAASKDKAPKVVPEIDHWVFSWKDIPTEDSLIKVVFDRKPVLLADCPVARPAGDGSVMLPAFSASTFGEKLRFEPQWYKNTVGYWVKPGDYATWKLKLKKPGQYSVAILQGCGKGQGGSDAVITLHDGEQAIAELPFKTVDTGHFQNFRWNHLGLIDVAKSGEFQLKIQPKRISKGALFDVRAIHLVPQSKPSDR